MKYKAVIFDLFGTLTRNPSRQANINLVNQMAGILEAPSEEFQRLWWDTFNDRCDGTFPTIEANIEHICRKLGVDPGDGLVGRATRLRADVVRRDMAPRPEAPAVLARLKENGYGIALISDCSPPVPEVWPDTPFSPYIDFPVFSCIAGLKKPDPRIYRLATGQLGVEPADCLYVGDGSSRELTGATAVGMRAVLIREKGEDSSTVYRVNEETTLWQGPSINSLTKVLELVNNKQ